jgi:transcription elongation factor Elf1
MDCPKCQRSLTIDYTPEFNKDKPYEIICYNCGWFSERYKTEQEAQNILEDKNQRNKMSNELISCPFCGEKESLKPILLPTTKGEPWKAIKCMSCGATGPISKDGLEANRLWGTRCK